MAHCEWYTELPGHLRQFIVPPQPASYTPRDHAAWRFLLHRLDHQLRDTAHPIYREGLRKTGISLDHIPSPEEMNNCLRDIGWQTVLVDGVIPPAVFMEFHAYRILPIAQNMRTVDHLLYTPTPDIVHEAAGHAPFLIDPDYADYLQRFGEVGMRALSSRHDLEIFEAVRRVSIIKEDPTASTDDIAAAQRRLDALRAQKNKPSEATLLARLHWWTVEYGLVGSCHNYRLFGAGLLSSLAESRHCLNDRRVAKLPLTLDCIFTEQDITHEQPQLYVADGCTHLQQLLECFAQAMAWKIGGAAGLRQAKSCGTVATAEYDSGIQISGQVSKLLCDAMGNAIYLSTTGPSQLAWHGRQLVGHGPDHHTNGIGSPIGEIIGLPHCLSDYTIDELRERGIATGQSVVLRFVSGIRIHGWLEHIERQGHRNVALCLNRCLVTSPDGQALHTPDEPPYIMAIGERIVSVFGGAADREKFTLYNHEPSPVSARVAPPQNRLLYRAYQTLRDCRAKGIQPLAALADKSDDTLSRCLARHPEEWLLRIELLELLERDHPWWNRLWRELELLRDGSPERRELIDTALAHLGARLKSA